MYIFLSFLVVQHDQCENKSCCDMKCSDSDPEHLSPLLRLVLGFEYLFKRLFFKQNSFEVEMLKG